MTEYILLNDLVGKELQLLLHYEEVKNSPLLSRFLEFVVEKKLSGQDDEIKEYTIGVKALGKPKDFNPQLDASVRIHAGRLRRILYDYYTGPGKNDEVVIKIPKGTYVPVFENRSFQDSREPLRAPSRIEHVESTRTANPHAATKPILAVLPFRNLSSDDSKDYFVKGIGEQLSTDFARFQNISVISYYSTDQVGFAMHDLQEMKKSTNIDYVLTGSVRFINELVRLNIQLIEAQSGQIAFADTYSRHLTENIFEIQEEIAEEILNMVAGDHGIIILNKSQSTPLIMKGNSSVQEAVYSYFNYTSEFENQKFPGTVDALEKAVAAEPQNALASALLASMYMFHYSTKKEHDLWQLEKAFELSLSGVRSDPNCQHAQKALAWALLLSDKKEKSLEVIDHCIRLNPKAASVIALMALAYVCQGEYTQGFKWLLETTHLSPAIHAGAKFGYCLYYFHKGDYEESLRWLDRLNPVQTPLFLLIRVALQGKIQRKGVLFDVQQIGNTDNIRSLVNRMIFDPALRLEIVNGLELAGLTVK
jgi:TolB-like protein